MNPFEARLARKRKVPVVNGAQPKGSGKQNHKKVTVENVKRNLLLLADLRREERRGLFVDNRLGEKTPGLSETQKAAKRMQRLRMRRAAHGIKRSYQLSELNDELEEQHMGCNNSAEKSNELVMTHGGKPLVSLSDDTLAATGLLDDDHTDSGNPKDEDLIPAAAHFGGGESQDIKTRSRKEIYQEIVGKSKLAKAQRVAEKDQQEEKLEELDMAFKNLHEALNYNPAKWSAGGVENSKAGQHPASRDEGDLDYDILMKSLLFDRRTCPTDRVKTPEELLAERVVQLDAMEKARQLAEIELAQNEIDQKDEESDEENLSQDDGSHNSSSNDSSVVDETEDDESDDGHSQSSRIEEADGARELMEHFWEEYDSNDSKRNSTRKIENETTKEHRHVMTHVPLHATDSEIIKNDQDESRRNEKMNQNQILGETEEQIISDNEFIPEWALNGSDEKHLPYKLPFPASLEEMKRLFQKEKSRSQWKLLHRLRVLCDTSLDSDSRYKKSQLLRMLLSYLEESLVNQFERRNKFAVKEPFETVPYNAFELIEALQEHITDLAQTAGNIKIVLDFIVPRLIGTCIQFRPAVAESLQKLKSYIQWKSQLEDDGQSYRFKSSGDEDNAKYPTSQQLALIALIATIFPRRCTAARTFVVPARLLLDSWSAELCQMHQCSFRPVSLLDISNELNQESSSTHCPHKVEELPRVPDDQVHLGFILLGFHLIFIQSTSCYSSTVLPLACGLLHTVLLTSSIPTPHHSHNILFELSNSIKLILSTIRSATVTTPFLSLVVSIRDSNHPLSAIIVLYFSHQTAGSLDLLLMNVVFPTTTFLLAQNLSASLRKLVESLHHEMIELIKQPLSPLRLGPKAPQGIRMLTPRYVDPTQLSGARYLRMRGASEEQVARRKLRKEVKDARKGAARQLRRDAEFIGAIQAREKRKRDEQLEQGYRRFIKILNQDREEIHKMRTSGGSMDTSLKTYAARKKLKKQDIRKRRNKTA